VLQAYGSEHVGIFFYVGVEIALAANAIKFFLAQGVDQEVAVSQFVVLMDGWELSQPKTGKLDRYECCWNSWPRSICLPS